MKAVKASVVIALLFFSSFAHGGDADPVMGFFNGSLSGKPQGIYEHDGNVFTLVRLPFDDLKDSDEVKDLEAALVAQRLFSRWSEDRYRHELAKAIEDLGKGSDGVELAREILSEEWVRSQAGRVKGGHMREFVPPAKDGVYTLCQVFKKPDFGRQIPQARAMLADGPGCMRKVVEMVGARSDRQMDRLFLRRLGAYDLLSVGTAEDFPDFNGRRFKEDLSAFLARCDSAEAEQGDLNESSFAEFTDAQEKTRRYLVSAETPKTYYRQGWELGTPRRRDVWQVVPAGTVCETNVFLSVSTNKVVPIVEDRRFRRFLQKNGDGFLAHPAWTNGVREETTSVFEGIVVTNRRVSITTRTTNKLVRVSSGYTGTPRFQMLFLSNARLQNAPAARRFSSQVAEKAFYDPKASLGQKEGALYKAICENPGDALLWNLLGRCFRQRGDEWGAAICFRNALKLNRRYEYPLVNLASSYQALGYRRLAAGLALVARGVAMSDWTLHEADAILGKAD